ncbi:THUMP domain [Dillenia turbinata]|uniref:THUMP domain n=1 Tax=Dillenia turbinata TaxID=194707 RepID=A0AAN8Z047_9MAGN
MPRLIWGGWSLNSLLLVGLSKREVKMAETEGGERDEREMKPWEQHSAVISIPRYDYKAPSTLLQHSLCGFLITCPIKREKSATKEIISILEKYIASSRCDNCYSLEDSGETAVVKRRKTCGEEINEESLNRAVLLRETPSSHGKTEKSIEDLVLSLVKLTRSGLILLTFPKDNSGDTVDIVAKIHQSLKSGSLRPPLWCHRVFPVQATCSLNDKALPKVVSKLVLQFVNDNRSKFSRPIKFAVGYNRRGIEETEMKALKGASGDSSVFALLDRNKCFSVVAAAVKDVVADSEVDLKAPELCVLVELLPLSGVPNGCLVVAVAVLPSSLVSTKPRLSVKALVQGGRFSRLMNIPTLHQLGVVEQLKAVKNN